MLTDFYATKKGMTQAWTVDGKRLAVTRLQADDMVVARVLGATQVELGVGHKKAKNVSKPLRISHEKNNLSVMPAKLIGATWSADDSTQEPAAGAVISVLDTLHVGDVVAVSGTSKGRGFAGVVKRYGFKGGPKTHGQSDRTRAVGSVGAGTTPGRVFKGKRMPGHYGVETKTISGLLVVHVDEVKKEIWVSGPVPGHINSVLKISTTGTQQPISLDLQASNIQISATPAVQENSEDSQSDEPNESISAESVANPEVELPVEPEATTATEAKV